jgi:DNA polymerase-3 subunit delta
MKHAGPKALAFCEKPPARPRIALIFGGDAGLVSSAADMLAKAWLPNPDPMNLIRLTDDDLRRDAALLGDELAARSLLGGDRLVRMRVEREAGAGKHVLAALADIDAGTLRPEATWIVEAGDLGKSSALRSGFEASANAAALQLYADDEASVSAFVSGRLAAAKVIIEPDALALLVSELPGDRRLAISEVEKLELYAMDLGRAVTTDDIARIASAEQPRGADDAADAAIAGDAAGAARSLDRFLDAGGNAISAMRTLHFRMLRVADASASGAGSGMRLRPPVFDRDWPAFSRALKDWSGPRLHGAFARLYEAEKACKQAGAPTDAIIRTLIDRISRREV